ncbi:calcium ATPase [Hortaea werneckii]|nr:calcium ATPase [Hortaea werneckii]
MDNAYVRSPKEVLEHFNVSEQAGLSDITVTASLQKYGKNAIPEEPPTPLWELVLEQFKDQLVIILLASAAISFVLALFEEEEGWTAFVDPIVILTILVLNAIVGVSQESSAEKAIAALQEYSANKAKVVRNGRLSEVKAEELVPGDVVHVAVGDRIPADCRVLSIHSNSFRIDQSILTGESESVGKDVQAIKDAQAVKQDQTNMLFSGTTVVTGTAHAVVVLTGSNTAIGDIHESITAQISQPTPLKEKLNDFGDMLAKVISAICILVWLINIQHFSDPSFGGSWTKGAIYYLKIAVSLGVAAIPEGLAVVITTCLALGTRKMAAKNAIVRSLPSVETLGSCSVICSDKTGTLTTNMMSVSKVVHVNEAGTGLEEMDVEGTSFAPEGAVSKHGKTIEHPAASSPTVAQMTEVAAICNGATLSYDSQHRTFNNVGEPTEGALRSLVEKIGTTDAAYNSERANLTPNSRLHYISKRYEEKAPKISVYEFSRDRKSMSVLVGNGNSKRLLVKGAPESILARCTHCLVGSNGQRQQLSSKFASLLQDEVTEYGNRGLRVMALASIDNVDANLASKAKTTQQYEQLEQGMTLLGLVGMLDPPRPEVAESIKQCRQAGIRVVVITGDNQNTAETICRQIGVFGENENLKGKSFTGRQFDDLSDSDKLKAAKNASLFSRTEPGHKSKLVDLLQSAGEVVAMTGDGVNDAPALKKSDIGVAMGTGTDVAKLAADMVLADDNFATIEAAVEEGRSIYNNTQQFIRYLISSNIGEVVSIFLTAALGMPEALIPVQLLWVNLVTDGLPATALSFNPPDHDVMKRPPRKRDEPLVGGWLFFRYMVIGTYVGLATVGGYAWWFMFYQGGPQITFWQLTHFHRCSSAFPEIGCAMFTDASSRTASTISLSVLVVIEMLNAMNALSSSESLLTLPLWNNMKLIYAITLSMVLHYVLLYTPLLQSIFGIVPLGWEEWKIVLAWSAPIIVIDEVLKALERAFFMPKSGLEDELREAAWESTCDGFITEMDAKASCRSHSCGFLVYRRRSDVEKDRFRILPDKKILGPKYQEHLAGPGCTSTSGYNGHKISAREMQHVISCQCLAEKRDDWRPEPGDRDFELKAEHCFLTGISKGGVWELDVTGLAPVRHGVSETDIENDNPAEIRSEQFGLDTGELCALPMHPRYFELFQRISIRCFGRVDIDGLWRLREEKGNYVNRFEGMPRNPDVELVSEQWYSARPGTEYLAADPVDVPGLSTLIQSCLVKEGDVCESVFDTPEHIKDSAEHFDPFSMLPPELQQTLLWQLSRQDVANLRLVSPAFRQLPQSYFRRLVETEMPWLWELSDLPKHSIDFYRLWCRLHEADGGSQQDMQEREGLEQTPNGELNALPDELESEGTGVSSPLPTGSSAGWDKRTPKVQGKTEAAVQAGYENGMCQRKPENVLLGLRNRRRIWQDLNVIVRMISELELSDDGE